MSPPISHTCISRYFALLIILILIVGMFPAMTIAEGHTDDKTTRGTPRLKQVDVTLEYDVAPLLGYTQGDIAVPMLRFFLKTRSGGKVQIDHMNITHKGTGSPSDIKKIAVWLGDRDGWFEPGIDDVKLVEASNWTGGTYTIVTLNPSLAIETLHPGDEFYITYDFTVNALDTHGVEITLTTDIWGADAYVTDSNNPKLFPLRSSNIGINLTSFFIFKLETITIFDITNIQCNSFYSGQAVAVNCNLSHTWGKNSIYSADITIITSDGKYPVNNQPMTKLYEDGPLWKRFRYVHYLSSPAARGKYTINITGVAKGYNGQATVNWSTDDFTVLNYPPKILGIIPDQHKTEDESWNIDIGLNKSDIEDEPDELNWRVSSIEMPIDSIDVNGDLLFFNLIENVYGNDEVWLHLEDSDGDEVTTTFWVNISSVNDYPRIDPPIPNQVKDEDSDKWTVDLSSHMSDAENLPSQLKWSVWDVNENIYSVEVDENFLRFSLVPDAWGEDVMYVNLTDMDGQTTSQAVNVTINSVNDAPVWSPIESIIVQELAVQDVLNLEKYIEDIDTPKYNINFKVVSNDNSKRIEVSIDNYNYIDISLIVEGYTGFANIVVSAFDGDTTVNQSFNIFATMKELETNLRTPPTGAKLSTKSPQLSWFTNIPPEFDEFQIAYDLYFGKDKAQVEALNPSVIFSGHQLSENFIPSSPLTNGSTYYWTVIPILIDQLGEVLLTGECVDGVWNFMIDLSAQNEAPLGYLKSPSNQAVLTGTTVGLVWDGYDPNGDSPLFYELYFGTDRDDVLSHEETVEIKNLSSPAVTTHMISDLTEDTVYYWTVVPTDGKLTGNCIDEVWEFGINAENVLPTVTLEYPENNGYASPTPELFWTCEDPDPFENMLYFIYISENDLDVFSMDPDVIYRGRGFHQNLMKITPALKNDTKYYWTVKPQDSYGNGICLSGVWSFTIKVGYTNHLPKVSLISPSDGAILNEKEVQLTWEAVDEDENDHLSYKIYFSTNKQLVEKYDATVLFETLSDTNTYKISGLENGSTYYWAVIPNDGKSNGLCLNNYWSFRVDITKEPDTPDPQNNSTGNITKIEAIPFLDDFMIIMIGIVIIVIAILVTAMVLKRSKKKDAKDEKSKEEKVVVKKDDNDVAAKPKPTPVPVSKTLTPTLEPEVKKDTPSVVQPQPQPKPQPKVAVVVPKAEPLIAKEVPPR